MTPAKKKKTEEDKAQESDRLREAIISKIREGEPREGEPASPTSPEADRAEERESLLTRQVALFGPRLREMAAFCRQFATLLDVGIPLVRSLQILSERTEHPRLKKVVREVAEDVEKGNRLSSALEKHPRIFSPMFVNVVKVGESGGILEGSIRRLADVLESKASIRRRIAAACAYPVAALTVAFFILLGIMVWAIPRFEEIYNQIDTPLPRPTQMLINLSRFVRHDYLIYGPVLIILAGLLYLFRRSEAGKRFFDWCKLVIPLLRTVNVKIAIARTTRALGSLVTAGVPLLESLKITSDGAENILVSEAIERVRVKVESGGKLEDQLREETLVFPPIVTDMLAIGDEGGALDVMLNKLADTYDEDVESTLRGLTAIVEPLLIVTLGLVVICIAVALLLPYYSLAQHIMV